MARLERKFEDFGERMHSLETTLATSENDRHHMDGRFDRIESQLSTSRNDMRRLVWIIITGIAVAIGQFVLRGGLNT